MKKITYRFLELILCNLMFYGLVYGQTFPNKPIRLIVPFEAGGTSDFTARLIAQQLESKFKTSVIVENRPGANGVIAAGIVSQSKPDGYTLLHTTPAFIINPLINKSLSYDVFKDFVPVSNIGIGTGYVLVVNPALPIKSVNDLLAYAKSKHNELTYASPGVGNALHLAAAQFVDKTAIKGIHVPYKGTTAGLLAVSAGDVDFMILPPTVVFSFVQSGKVKLIAFTGQKRSADFPNTPTLAESGLKDLTISSTWLGWFAPSATPVDVVNVIANEIQSILKGPEVQADLMKSGFRVEPRTPVEFQGFLKSEYSRIGQIVKKIDLN